MGGAIFLDDYISKGLAGSQVLEKDILSIVEGLYLKGQRKKLQMQVF